MLPKLTGMLHAVPDIVLGYFRNFGNRLDLIQSLASTDQGTMEMQALLPSIREFIVIRNKYTHGLWQMESDGQPHWWRLISWLTDATRNTRSTFVTKDSVKADCAKVRATLHAAINYSQMVVPKMLPEAPPPGASAYAMRSVPALRTKTGLLAAVG